MKNQILTVLFDITQKISVECIIEKKIVVFFISPSRFHGHNIGVSELGKDDSLVVDLGNLLLLEN